MYREDWSTAVNQAFDPTFEESEMTDYRIDFGEYSVWLRNGKEVEGSLPKPMQRKMNAIVKQLGYANQIEYVR